MALTVYIGLEPYIEIQNTISNDVGNEILGLTMAMRIKVGLNPHIHIQNPISDDVGNDILGLEVALLALNPTSKSKTPFLTTSEMRF